MSLYKRDNVWWINICHEGKRIRKSTGTSNKTAAQRLHDHIKADAWRKDFLQEKADHIWLDAVIRWLNESQHKKSLDDDKAHLRWLDPFLRNKKMREITRGILDKITSVKLSEGVKPSTVNRMLEVVRAILRKAEREWEWIDRAPIIRMLKEDNRRIRWITKEEAQKLIQNLPSHLADMAAFALSTGLRMSNITGLQWGDIDLVKRHAWIHPDQAKAKKAIPVPLNSDAVAIIRRQLGKHSQYIFVYKGNPISECNTKAWKKGLKRAGIESFRWHDLRHTWASWHVQHGTSLQELQQLGGWASFEMVLRYAHLSSDHLKEASERISVTILSQSGNEEVRNVG
ncbi:MAG: site-specific integrase [Gammaproteobacteria bacterium]|nr:site-specific integrase [Gammaproteobacteria bacterium]